ncbi:MAG: hypothetical protein K2X29_12480 [Candidatus Obscuribacterales bacterium]|nr:hypothetical protein [Candidatus Obscuribacterales bacterium]
MSWLFPAAFIPLIVVLLLIACFRRTLNLDTAPITPHKRHKWFLAALIVAAVFTLLLVSEIFVPGEPGEFFSNFTHIFSRIALLPVSTALILVGLLQRRGARSGPWKAIPYTIIGSSILGPLGLMVLIFWTLIPVFVVALVGLPLLFLKIRSMREWLTNLVEEKSADTSS